MGDQKATCQKWRDAMLLAQHTQTKRWFSIEPILSMPSLLAEALLCEFRDKHAC